MTDEEGFIWVVMISLVILITSIIVLVVAVKWIWSELTPWYYRALKRYQETYGVFCQCPCVSTLSFFKLIYVVQYCFRTNIPGESRLVVTYYSGFRKPESVLAKARTNIKCYKRDENHTEEYIHIAGRPIVWLNTEKKKE